MTNQMAKLVLADVADMADIAAIVFTSSFAVGPAIGLVGPGLWQG